MAMIISIALITPQFLELVKAAVSALFTALCRSDLALSMAPVMAVCAPLTSAFVARPGTALFMLSTVVAIAFAVSTRIAQPSKHPITSACHNLDNRAVDGIVNSASNPRDIGIT
jgi:hypothetical protein